MLARAAWSAFWPLHQAAAPAGVVVAHDGIGA